MTGEQDDIGHYGSKDLRTEEERKSKFWVTISEEKATGISIQQVRIHFGTSRKTKNGGNIGSENKLQTKKIVLWHHI